MRWPAPSSTRIGAGVQPVPGPTLPESSSADRKAWLTKGSPPARRSQAPALRPDTPEAILAMTSDSWSAIGFPDERIGMNRRLRALRQRADRPAIDRHPAASLRFPLFTELVFIHGNELGIGEPHRQPSPPR